MSFLIPLQWKDTSVNKKGHDPLIVSSLSVTSNALFDYSCLALGHAIGFRVVRRSLLFYSQRETILSKFLSVDTASLVTLNLSGTPCPLYIHTARRLILSY